MTDLGADERSTLFISCPNGHFEAEIKAKHRTFMHGAVLKHDGPQPCPACGELAEWDWETPEGDD